MKVLTLILFTAFLSPNSFGQERFEHNFISRSNCSEGTISIVFPYKEVPKTIIEIQNNCKINMLEIIEQTSNSMNFTLDSNKNLLCSVVNVNLSFLTDTLVVLSENKSQFVFAINLYASENIRVFDSEYEFYKYYIIEKKHLVNGNYFELGRILEYKTELITFDCERVSLSEGGIKAR